MTGDTVIDASLFMAMHSNTETIRRSAKAFFTQRLGDRLVMSLEEVGRCDDLVWRYPRDVQDSYYPFMDNLHTDLKIERIGYQMEDVRAALESSELQDLHGHERLLLGMVMRREALLYTANPRLIGRPDLPTRAVPLSGGSADATETAFPDPLEHLYRESLTLRVHRGMPTEEAWMYHGTIVPLITPLTHDGTVCQDSVRRLVMSVRDDVSALMPVLSSGEGWQLSESQWNDMVAGTVHCSEGLPVLAGIQLPTTAEVIERARKAAELAVNAVVVGLPYHPGISQQQIFDHYRMLLDAVEIPVFVYNEAAISKNSIELDTLIRICRLNGVVGVKESSGSPELTSRLAAAVDVPVFEGWENLLGQVTGTAGMVGPLANLEPALCTRMLMDPSPDRQAEVDAACERYGLFREDWYRHVKKELHRRAVISTDLTVEDLR
jgi:4-hydroxy-tetrahydrodipicolinate synthase